MMLIIILRPRIFVNVIFSPKKNFYKTENPHKHLAEIRLLCYNGTNQNPLLQRKDFLMNEIIFYVSPSGCDKNEGSRALPFKTIARAQEAARQSNTPVTVEVLAGTYRETLVFDSRDSGDTYRTSENAVITGGLTVPCADTSVPSADILGRLTAEAAERVRRIDLKAYGVLPEAYDTLFPIGSYSTTGKYDGYRDGINVEVFEDDRRMTLARYPDTGYIKLDRILDVGDVAEFPEQNYFRDWHGRRNHRGGTYIIDKQTNERLKNWKTPETAWMFGYFYHDWADSSTPVAEINTVNRYVKPVFVSHFAAKAGALYYFYNVLEELDAPGEFYLDRENGLLYVYPSSDEAVFDISLSTVPLIRLNGADNLTLSGFTMTCTRESAVVGSGNGNRIDGLLIKNVANHGVVLSGKDNLVENCEITHTGRGGIYLNGGDRATLTPGSNRAVNNYIHDFSEVFQTYQCGVNLSGVGNLCAHNEICGSPHMAIGYNGNEHRIEYNYIHDVVLHSSDAGAIYSGFDWAGHGTVIRYNLLKTIGGEGFYPDGIYWDDGLSGQTAYGNILIDVKKNGFLVGGGRDNIVRDNIILGESHLPIQYDDRNRDGFVNGGWAHQACDTPDAPHWKNLEKVPYTSELWAAKYPTLARVIKDFDKFNDPDFPINPANSVVENNVIINKDARFGRMAQSVYDYNDIGENYTYHSCEEANFDPETLKFVTPREGFPEIPVDEIGRK